MSASRLLFLSVAFGLDVVVVVVVGVVVIVVVVLMKAVEVDLQDPG